MYHPKSEVAVPTGNRGAGVRVSLLRNSTTSILLMLALCGVAWAQAGRRQPTSNAGGVMVNIVAQRTGNTAAPITAKQLSIYDNGIEQTIRNLTADPSPARIV